MAFQRSEGWISPFTAEELIDYDKFISAIDKYFETNRKNALDRTDFEQNPSKIQCHKSLFSNALNIFTYSNASK